MNVFHTVTVLLSTQLCLDPLDIGEDFVLDQRNGVVPVDIAKLAMACEEAFGFALYDEKIAQWRTVGDACKHLSELLEEGVGEAAERTEEERTAWFYA